MIVTIDGPAGAGKSSVARALAERLGFRFLDTGAMYRGVALAAIEGGVDLRDDDALEHLTHQLDIQLADDRVLLDGRDVSAAIRTVEVTNKTRFAADHPGVRERLVELQRAAAEGRNVVTEGRDQGTVVFPEAECKIFLTASARERARRRHRYVSAQGEETPLEEILAQQEQRDARDRTRPVAPLIQAADAIEVNTDGMTQAEVVERLYTMVRATTAGSRRGS